MNAINQTGQLTLQEVFASTLIHSLWQGAILVVVIWLLRILLRNNTRFNYLLSLFALIGLMSASICTFFYLWSKNTVGFYPYSFLTKVMDNPDFLYWFDIIWLIGSSFYFLRFLFSHYNLRKLINRSKPIVNTHWIEIFKRLRNYYSINKSIVMLQSDQVCSAFLTGVIKPVIIIPTSWINQLSLKEAECILAHELSHVFNKDHWVNLFIHFTEIIFYFNPAVHILISHVKLERELRADSSACKYLREPLLYAKLILKIEESSGLTPVLALPFFQQRKQLKRRIESVLHIKSSKNEFTSGIALFALTLGVLFFSCLTIKEQITLQDSCDSNSISCESKNFQIGNFNRINNIHQEIKIVNIENENKDINRSKNNNKINRNKNTVTTPKNVQNFAKDDLNNASIIAIQNNNLNLISDKSVQTIAGINIKNRIAENLEKSQEFQREINDYGVLAFENSNELNILQQIERELKSERLNRKTIIYEISKTKKDSSKFTNGGNWTLPRQIKCYAPVETKTYIIIKSRNNPSFDTELDWNVPGKMKKH